MIVTRITRSKSVIEKNEKAFENNELRVLGPPIFLRSHRLSLFEKEENYIGPFCKKGKTAGSSERSLIIQELLFSGILFSILIVFWYFLLRSANLSWFDSSSMIIRSHTGLSIKFYAKIWKECCFRNGLYFVGTLLIIWLFRTFGSSSTAIVVIFEFL